MYRVSQWNNRCFDRYFAVKCLPCNRSGGLDRAPDPLSPPSIKASRANMARAPPPRVLFYTDFIFQLQFVVYSPNRGGGVAAICPRAGNCTRIPETHYRTHSRTAILKITAVRVSFRFFFLFFFCSPLSICDACFGGRGRGARCKTVTSCMTAAFHPAREKWNFTTVDFPAHFS